MSIKSHIRDIEEIMEWHRKHGRKSLKGTINKKPVYSYRGIRVYEIVGEKRNWAIAGFGPTHIISDDCMRYQNRAQQALIHYFGMMEFNHLSIENKIRLK